MRTRHDADDLLARVQSENSPNGSRVVIVGGGLLGLELAASVRVMGAVVTVILGVNGLMTRHLDAVAS